MEDGNQRATPQSASLQQRAGRVGRLTVGIVKGLFSAKEQLDRAQKEIIVEPRHMNVFELLALDVVTVQTCVDKFPTPRSPAKAITHYCTLGMLVDSKEKNEDRPGIKVPTCDWYVFGDMMRLIGDETDLREAKECSMFKDAIGFDPDLARRML